jgi:hypothetical protein
VITGILIVIHHSSEETRSGLKEWAVNGLHSSPEHSYLAEHIQIEDFYGHPLGVSRAANAAETENGPSSGDYSSGFQL